MKKVTVAIDFGTSGSTHAFAFNDSKDNIIDAAWPGLPGKKNPTEIILNENMETIKFGKECLKYLGELKSSEEKFYHFTDIKMKLYNRETKIKANNDNKVLDIELIISKILICIKKDALKVIQSIRPETKESEINWKVTVPAIWDNNSKEIMKKASILAGIFSEPLLTFFALEPEAAACDYVNSTTSDKNAIKEGNKYIICDIGGGTIDISTHTRIKNGDKVEIEEIYPPCGGSHGSTYINKAFIERVIKQIFGKDSIDKLNDIMNNPQLDKDLYIDYCILLEEIEEFKIDIENNESKRINCTLFEKLVKNDIKTLIDNYNKKCPEKWKITNNSDYKIYFPYQIMIDLTKEIIVDKVINHLENILKHIPDIQSIIYAGSVSSNELIISMIKENIPKVNHYCSAYPALAVARGAVRFGFDPFVIKSRISKYTIGINVNTFWNEKLHGNREDLKYFNKLDNCDKCKNVFSSIILMNQKVGIDEIISKNYSISSSKKIIKFYKTIEQNVIFIDENLENKKLLQFGELTLDVGESFDINNRDIVIELYLGGTFIDAKVKYKNVEIKGVFDFSQEE